MFRTTILGTVVICFHESWNKIFYNKIILFNKILRGEIALQKKMQP
jgi:hypothetical protein